MERVDCTKLALKKVKINGNIIGKFGAFEIEQTFKNNTNQVLEVGYTFPIVETATVVGFEINVGDKVLKGKCKEAKEAKNEYIRNLLKGNSAYLMEQKTDNVFTISVGKIKKDEEVKIKISYIDKFEIIDNKINMIIPTLVTPRYKSEVTENLKYEKVEYTVDFNINISKVLNRKSIQCTSHEIKIIEEENVERIEVLDYDLSKDFKLNIELKNELTSNAITSKTRENNNMLYLSFMPEITDTYEDSEKEYVFIVDVSGSMMGEKLEETKKAVIECLKQLDVGDKFNIIAFETEFEAMNIRAIEYNEENLKKAIEYVNNLRPLGGTEILNPIKFALYERDCEKIILLFTDGQVGNEEEILTYVNDTINRSRIFTFGIDSNVNSAFIKQLAKVGNGKAELILPGEKIDDKIIRTFARIQTPLLENVEINYGKNKIIDEIREEKCLFNYEFFNVFAKIEKIEDDIELKGTIQNKEYTWKIKKEDIKTTDVDLEILFAKQEMERLEEYIRNTFDKEKIENYKKMIIEISEKYNINSKYTSFITVNEREHKIFDVPKYQETTLSNKTLRTGIRRKMATFASAMPIFEEECCDMDTAYVMKSTPMPYGERSMSRRLIFIDVDLLREKVEKSYNEFLKQNNKSMKMFLLYAIYYLKTGNLGLNIEVLIEFLKKHEEQILIDEENKKLLYIIYINLSKESEKAEILDLLDEDYKKLIYSNAKINTNIKNVTKEDIDEIVKNDTITENIESVILYLINCH